MLKMIMAEGTIDHSNQALDEIPKMFMAAQYRQITGLNLSKNYIGIIPDTLFNSIPYLLELNLSHNKL